MLDSLSSRLAPLHFRNQLYYLREHLDGFRGLAEAAWPGLKVGDPQVDMLSEAKLITVGIRDGDFTGELAIMGHGLQMWLQTMWFLARAATDGTVILDEPDVYMHADLQRKLIGTLRNKYDQTILATHSPEIIGDVEADDIMIVDRRYPRSEFACDEPGVQRVLAGLGSAHNLQLMRIASAQRLVIVEGEDLKLLRRLQARLGPGAAEPLDALPNFPLGGAGDWRSTRLLPDALKSMAGEGIVVYCVLDSDYRPSEQIAGMREEANGYGIELHVWERKEIENYLLVPTAIARVMAQYVSLGTETPDAELVGRKLDEIAEALQDTVVEHTATGLQQWDPRLTAGTASSRAKKLVTTAWQTQSGRLSRIPGKEALGRLREWSQTQFGVSLSDARLVSAMSRSDIPEELREVIGAIAGRRGFQHEAPID